MPETLTEVREEVYREVERMSERRAKPISTTTHGVLDYTLSPTLAFAPELLGFPKGGAASAVPRVYGAAGLVYGPMTRYELGMYPVLPMRTHLIIDALSAVFIAASPWLLGFGRRAKPRTWVPHLAFALSELAIVAFSDDRSKR
jgi:hypothetical protein